MTVDSKHHSSGGEGEALQLKRRPLQYVLSYIVIMTFTIVVYSFTCIIYTKLLYNTKLYCETSPSSPKKNKTKNKEKTKKMETKHKHKIKTQETKRTSIKHKKQKNCNMLPEECLRVESGVEGRSLHQRML